MPKITLGADVGGSHITCRLYDTEHNRFHNDRVIRIPVDSQSSRELILQGWVSAIKETAGDHPLNELGGIGFAMPGPFDYPGGVAWFKGVQKFEALYGVNVRQELISRLSLPDHFPVKFQNDAVCFAIGESLHGAAARLDRILAITLGTGFGTAFIEKHRPVAGKYGVPEDGFLYHIPFGHSIADDHFSTRWFQQEFKKLTGKSLSGVKELADMALYDEPAASIFKTFGQNLGTFLTPWLTTFQAGGLVIGGNIAASWLLFGPVFLKLLKLNGIQTEVILSELGEDAALMGSASLCNEELFPER